MQAAINGPNEFAWLEMAARCEGAAGTVLDLDGIDLSRPLVAQFILDTGLIPTSAKGCLVTRCGVKRATIKIRLGED